MKIIFLIVAYFIGQQNAYKEKYKPDEMIMPKVRDLTAVRLTTIDHGPSLVVHGPMEEVNQIPKKLFFFIIHIQIKLIYYRRTSKMLISQKCQAI